MDFESDDTRFFRRLSVRVFVVGAVLMVLPSTLLFYTGYRSLEGVMRAAVREQVERSVESAGARLNGFFDSFLRLSSRIAQNQFLAAALRPGSDVVRRSADIDRVLETETGFFPFAGDLFFTIKSADAQLFTNWSRNLTSYDSLESLPLVRKARESEGFTVWESFAAPYIEDEKRRGRTFISLARLIPSEQDAGSALLLMSFPSALIGRLLGEVAVGPGTVLVLCDAQGQAFQSAGSPLPSPRLLQELVVGHRSGEVVGPWVLVRQDLRSVPGDLERGGLVLLALYPYDTLGTASRALLWTFSSVFLLLILTGTITGYFISRRIIRPLGRLAYEMRRWELGRPLPPSLLVPRDDEIGSLQKAFAALHGRIDELFAANQREHKIREHYRFVSQQAQLNPHFLFNSLNTLRFMAILNKSQNMLEAIDAVSTVLQHSIGRDTGRTTVGEELRSLESLVKVYNLRFGDAFSLEVVYQPSAAELAPRPVLRFLLYPAVENALVHGYPDRTGTGAIRITVASLGEGLRLEVRDWGAGMPQEKLASLFEESFREQGIGLYNIREMILQVYGSTARVEVISQPGEGTTVVFELPGPGSFKP